MKSFKQYITEAEKDNGPFPVSDADKKSLQRQTRASTESGEKIRRGLESAKERTSRTKRTVPSAKKLGVTPRILDAPDGTKVVTNMPEPARGTTGEVVDRVVDKLKTTGETKSGGRTASSSRPRGATAKSGDVGSFIRGEQSKGRPVSGTMQDVAGRKGAGYDFPKDAGTEKPKPTKPGSYVVDDKPKSKPRVKGNKPTGRLSKGNLVFPGDRSGAYAAAKAKIKDAPPAPAKPKPVAVKQSEVSKAIKQRLALRDTRKAKPTATQLKQFRLGQEKGYISKSGTPTAQGIQTYTTRRATKGFGDVGYDAAKRGVKDPLAAKRSVDNIVSRAAAGDKAARSEVKRSYKAMTRRYKDIVPSAKRTQAGMASVRSGLENTYNAPSATRPPSATPPPKPPTSPKPTASKGGGASTGGASTGGSRGGAAVIAPPKPPKTITKIASPPTPKTPTGPKVTSSTGGKLSDTIAPSLIGRARERMKTGVKSPITGLKTPPTKSQKSVKPQRGLPAVRKKAAVKAATSVATKLPATQKSVQTMVKSALGTVGKGVARAAGGAATGLDAYLNYRKYRNQGDNKLTSGLKSAFRTSLGYLGGAAGSALGSVAGPVGTVGGGIAGYSGGTWLADKVLGATKKKRETAKK